MRLELGTLPLRCVIKGCCLVFLQYILKQDKDDLIFKIFEAQFSDPNKGDWVVQDKQDLKDVNLDITFDQISIMSDYSYQAKVKRAIMLSAYNWLISEKDKQRSDSAPKGISLIYTELKLQDYFLPNNTLNNKQRNLLFSLRSRMVPVRTNFSHSYSELTCPDCLDKNQRDTQVHLLHCKKLLAGENLLVGNEISYDDLFSTDVNKQSAVVILLEKLLSKRRDLEKKSSHVSDPSDPNSTSL